MGEFSNPLMDSSAHTPHLSSRVGRGRERKGEVEYGMSAEKKEQRILINKTFKENRDEHRQ